MDSVDSSCHLYKRGCQWGTPCYRASEHSLFRGITRCSQSPKPHYRKMSKRLVLLQVSIQTWKWFLRCSRSQKDSSSLDLRINGRPQDGIRWVFELRILTEGIIKMNVCVWNHLAKKNKTKSGWNQANMFHLFSSTYLISISYCQYFYTLWSRVKIWIINCMALLLTQHIWH